ncbi:MAG: alanine--tRNA ligase, partial [Candidatus Micrarchaeota archaeon]
MENGKGNFSIVKKAAARSKRGIIEGYAMLSKESLKRQFAANYKEFYSVPLFEHEGFERKVCTVCGKGFWTAGFRDTCGDSSHEKYTFFRKNPRDETYASFWKKTADFWKKNNHVVIDRYPVLSRWRDDLPFTIASIVDFQRLEAGKVIFEYPANPLFVPQMCLRFPDIANVGITGRHFTCFMMAGQHAFNYPKEGYWKADCLEYNYRYLREVLQIPKEDITYGEDVWNMPDFSAFGPCIESFASGSELVNSVFMQYRQNEGGFSELEMKVIDVGWGFERLLWYYNGTRSAYDSVFPNEVNYMRERSSIELSDEILAAYASLSASLDVENMASFSQEKKKIATSLGLSLQEMEKGIAPLQAIYAIADHSRTLLFALNDGALPSNVGGGYNLRVLARRAFSFIEKYNFGFSLFDLAVMHAEDLKEVFPELSENLASVEKILEAERRKYKESSEKAKRIAVEILKKNPEISTKQMITLYESHGVNPETIEQVAKELKINAVVPTDFYSELTNQRVMQKERADSVTGKKIVLPDLDVSTLQPTAILYYDDVNLVTSTAKLLGWHKNALIFDSTLFYPEGGGQMNDNGKVKIGEWEFDLENVQKQGKVVLHLVPEKQASHFLHLKQGQTVVMQLNVERRRAIMKHHSATHMLLSACRQYFGNHVWQTGSEKDEDEAHLDVTHFEKPTLEDVHAIEKIINEQIALAIPVEITSMHRNEAEKQFGMRLYQGAGAVAEVLRIVKITDVDTEACGGTHVHNTSDVGVFKIKNVEQIQDGVIRFRYCASLAALSYLQEQEKLLDETSKVLSVARSELPKTAAKFLEEWKDQRKEIEKIAGELAASIAREQIAANMENKKVELKVSMPPEFVEKIADTIGK